MCIAKRRCPSIYVYTYTWLPPCNTGGRKMVVRMKNIGFHQRSSSSSTSFRRDKQSNNDIPRRPREPNWFCTGKKQNSQFAGLNPTVSANTPDHSVWRSLSIFPRRYVFASSWIHQHITLAAGARRLDSVCVRSASCEITCWTHHVREQL